MTYDIMKEIYEANAGRRNVQNLHRRITKAGEEIGELGEAFLYVTSMSNTKEKTWEDVREEAVDVILMGIDLALTPLPIDKEKSSKEIQQAVLDMVEKKLNKWKAQIAAGKDCTLTVIDGLD